MSVMLGAGGPGPRVGREGEISAQRGFLLPGDKVVNVSYVLSGGPGPRVGRKVLFLPKPLGKEGILVKVSNVHHPGSWPLFRAERRE